MSFGSTEITSPTEPNSVFANARFVVRQRIAGFKHNHAFANHCGCVRHHAQDTRIAGKCIFQPLPSPSGCDRNHGFAGKAGMLLNIHMRTHVRLDRDQQNVAFVDQGLQRGGNRYAEPLFQRTALFRIRIIDRGDNSACVSTLIEPVENRFPHITRANHAKSNSICEHIRSPFAVTG
jgi:hypothetical protein